jgi:hypothetical protein
MSLYSLGAVETLDIQKDFILSRSSAVPRLDQEGLIENFIYYLFVGQPTNAVQSHSLLEN